MTSPFQPIRPLDSQITSFKPATFGDEQKEVAPGFGKLLMGAINSVQGSFDNLEAKSNALITGRLNNLHEVVIAGEKSGIMLKLATQIASKISTACTTLFQMQI